MSGSGVHRQHEDNARTANVGDDPDRTDSHYVDSGALMVELVQQTQLWWLGNRPCQDHHGGGVCVARGRHRCLPGHMNALVAEAKSPCDIVLEMDRDQRRRRRHRRHQRPGQPDRGHAVLTVRNVDDVIVVQRSMAAGCAGVHNLLFFRESSAMLVSDADHPTSPGDAPGAEPT